MESTENISSVNAPKTNTPKPDVKKSWFTPCRQIGLKRKSPSVCTPKRSTASPVSNITNSSFKSHKLTFQTPVKTTNSSEAKRTKNEVNRLTPTCPNNITIQTSTLPSDEDRLRTIPTKHQNDSTPSLKTPNEFTKVVSVPRHAVTGVTSTLIRSTSKPDCFELKEDPTVEDVEHLRKRIQEKEEQLHALKTSHIYKTKQDTEKLSKLTKKWLHGCQEALLQLHEKTKSLGYQYTMMDLLMQLHIPNVLVQYDPELDDFKDST